MVGGPPGAHADLLRFQLSRRAAHVVLAGWALLWFVLMHRHGGVSWHFFVQGDQVLSDVNDVRGGLHLYATNPQLQIGPLAFALASVFGAGGPSLGALPAEMVMAAAGLLVLIQVCAMGDEIRARAGARDDAGYRLLLAGLAFAPVWMNLAVRFVHVDDVLALVLAVLAVHAVLRDAPVLAGLLLGMAVDAKPWALPMLALVLAVRPGRRIPAVLMALSVIAVVWMPFIVADPHSIMAAHFTIPNTSASSLRTIGVTSPATPYWDRPAQAALGLFLAFLAVSRGRWAGVVLLVVAARVVLDPGTYTYYVAGLAVGAIVWDQLGTRRTTPWWTWTTTVALFASRWLPMSPWWHGWINLGFFLLCVIVVVVGPPYRWQIPARHRRRRAPAPDDTPERALVGAGLPR
jgi:hypothetical protein